MKNRYSGEELEEFNVLINKKLVVARNVYNSLRQQFRELNEENTDERFDLEEGSNNYEREHLNKMAHRQQQFIGQLENALFRIKNGTYGICAETGELIDKKRLMLVPHTTKNIAAKKNRQLHH